jgi:hypothetical protein
MVWVRDNLNIHLAPELAEFARENKDWLRVYRLPVQAAVQADDPAAARAGRPGDRLGSGGAQLLDQPQHRRGGRLRAIAGEQARIGLHDPGQPAQLALAGEHSPGGIGDRGGGQQRIHPGDDPGENGQRIALIAVRAPVTARLAGPVAAGNGPPLAARCARPQRQPPDAHAAIPVLAVALQRGDLAVASGAPRRGDPGCPGRAQRQQQVPDDRGSRERPLVSSDGSAASAAARRRRRARPPACSTAARTVSRSTAGSAAVTTATTAATGSVSMSAARSVIAG